MIKLKDYLEVTRTGKPCTIVGAGVTDREKGLINGIVVVNKDGNIKKPLFSYPFEESTLTKQALVSLENGDTMVILKDSKLSKIKNTKVFNDNKNLSIFRIKVNKFTDEVTGETVLNYDLPSNTVDALKTSNKSVKSFANDEFYICDIDLVDRLEEKIELFKKKGYGCFHRSFKPEIQGIGYMLDISKQTKSENSTDVFLSSKILKDFLLALARKGIVIDIKAPLMFKIRYNGEDYKINVVK